MSTVKGDEGYEIFICRLDPQDIVSKYVARLEWERRTRGRVLWSYLYVHISSVNKNIRYAM